MILVDTSVLLDFFKGVKNNPSLCLQEIIKQQIPFGITSAVYQELLQNDKDFVNMSPIINLRLYKTD
jgi:predicted nucleic acid-binding protein